MAPATRIPTPDRIPTNLLILRASTVGFGLVGAVIGLGVGLVTYWPTAWFAALELGIPSTILGLLVGILAIGARRVFRQPERGSRTQSEHLPAPSTYDRPVR